MRRVVRVVLAALLAAPALAGVPACAQQIGRDHAGMAPAADPFADRVLDLHNRERARMGLPPLAWSHDLAEDAGSWAQVLAREGRFEHSPPEQRRAQGESLFKGTAGAYSIDEMIGGFLAESADFHPGAFPDVSRDGDWKKVAHYTQLIWRETREVGCAVVRNGNWDYLACRYMPAGNVVGMRVP